MERATDHSVEAAPGADVPKTSYGQILKSSALIGGSSVLTIGFGVIRTKAMAVMLGPAGFGLMGLYSSIVDLALAVASMGISSSGVRQIADSAASTDETRIARTVLVLRWIAMVLGVLGAVLVVVLSQPLSTLTFGTAEHAGAVALLGLAVLFRTITGGQGALIQGLRRIHDLALMGILGGAIGALTTIALVYLLGEKGIAPSLVGAAAVGLVISWWFSRRVKIARPSLSRGNIRQEAVAILKLGAAFMVSGLIMMGASYAVRAIVLRMEGLEAAGFYSAAWTLGGLYVGIILQAMGADFYPRLIPAADDNPKCNRLVNEQARVSMLLAAPGVIATITFAPLIIAIFYSADFSKAIEVLRWICLGIAMRVITWPMGFIIVAKNRQVLFIAIDSAWCVANIGLTWLCVTSFGVSGAGIAFFVSYMFHGVILYPAVRWLSGFRWSKENLKGGIMFTLSIGIVFVVFETLPSFWAYAIGVSATALSAAHSLNVLMTLLGRNRLPIPLQRIIKELRIPPPNLS